MDGEIERESASESERMDPAISRLRKTAEKHMRLVQCIHFLIQYLPSKFLHFHFTANTVHMCVCVFVVEFLSIFVACFMCVAAVVVVDAAVAAFFV